MAALGSQGIVVKCTAAIFFRAVDFGLSALGVDESRSGLEIYSLWKQRGQVLQSWT